MAQEWIAEAICCRKGIVLRRIVVKGEVVLWWMVLATGVCFGEAVSMLCFERVFCFGSASQRRCFDWRFGVGGVASDCGYGVGVVAPMSRVVCTVIARRRRVE